MSHFVEHPLWISKSQAFLLYRFKGYNVKYLSTLQIQLQRKASQLPSTSSSFPSSFRKLAWNTLNKTLCWALKTKVNYLCIRCSRYSQTGVANSTGGKTQERISVGWWYCTWGLKIEWVLGDGEHKKHSMPSTSKAEVCEMVCCTMGLLCCLLWPWGWQVGGK